MWSALDMGARRIGHGVRSYEDASLLTELAKRGIALELCPTSNLNTKVFDSLDQYPIDAFISAGVSITVNTDNMSVSNTTLAKEFEKLSKVYSFTETELLNIVKTSISASFANDVIKQKAFDRVDSLC